MLFLTSCEDEEISEYIISGLATSWRQQLAGQENIMEYSDTIRFAYDYAGRIDLYSFDSDDDPMLISYNSDGKMIKAETESGEFHFQFTWEGDSLITHRYYADYQGVLKPVHQSKS